MISIKCRTPQCLPLLMRTPLEADVLKLELVINPQTRIRIILLELLVVQVIKWQNVLKDIRAVLFDSLGLNMADINPRVITKTKKTMELPLPRKKEQGGVESSLRYCNLFYFPTIWQQSVVNVRSVSLQDRRLPQ